MWSYRMLAAVMCRALPSRSLGNAASTGKTLGFRMLRGETQVFARCGSENHERSAFRRATHTQFPQTTFTKDSEGPKNFGAIMLRRAVLPVKQHPSRDRLNFVLQTIAIFDATVLYLTVRTPCPASSHTLLTLFLQPR